MKSTRPRPLSLLLTAIMTVALFGCADANAGSTSTDAAPAVTAEPNTAEADAAATSPPSSATTDTANTAATVDTAESGETAEDEAESTAEEAATDIAEVVVPTGKEALAAVAGQPHVLWFWGAH